LALVESAKIHALTGKMNAAIENLNRAIETLLKIGFDKPEYTIEFYT